MTGDTTNASDAENVKGERANAPRVGRRDVMLGTAAAGAGVAAALVAGAEPAGAANGQAVLLGKSNSATAVTSVSTTAGAGLQGQTGASGASGVRGVDASSGGGSGVRGDSTHGDGVYGETAAANKSGVAGVDNSSGGGFGVWGYSTNGDGVKGSSTNGNGVHGASTKNGVYGETYGNDASGVQGFDVSAGGGYGVAGISSRGYGVYAYSATGTALRAAGNAQVTGSLSKGGGSFKIDHPLDPGGKYLYHSFVESPDMMNVYNGIAVLDASGSARVELPEWFEALNRDFRYALTALDRPAPELHVSARVANGAFSVAGGNAGQEVSWQVTGIRQDAWANAHRIPVEVDKPAEDRGRYLHPDLFGGEPITEIANARRHRDRAVQAAPRTPGRPH